MMKKMKRVSMESSPSYVFDEAAKNRFKHQSLMQDFNELQKETEEMKKKLQKVKRKKLMLLAEVKFLRRRYKYLLKNPSQKIPSERPVQPQIPNMRNQSSLKERNYKENVVSIKSLPAIDLNQISRGEETEELVWEPKRKDKKLKRSLVEGDALVGDLKLVCRDVGNGSNRPGKRKISWQDQVALRV